MHLVGRSVSMKKAINLNLKKGFFIFSMIIKTFFSAPSLAPVYLNTFVDSIHDKPTSDLYYALVKICYISVCFTYACIYVCLSVRV